MHVLLITGGHAYEREPFVAMWESFKDITLQEAQYPAVEASFEAAAAAQFDAFVFYDFGRTMSAGAKVNFMRLLQQGKGMVFLHHALCGHNDWPEYARIVGGAWIDKERTIDGRQYTVSKYHPNQTVTAHVEQPSHPVTASLSDYDMIEETYEDLYISPDTTPLLTTTHPHSNRLLAWSHTVEQARVVYVQPGHGSTAFNDANYRRLVQNSIHWVAQKPTEK